MASVRDAPLPADAMDTIASLAWSPASDRHLLAAASWDGRVRIYYVNVDVNLTAGGGYHHSTSSAAVGIGVGVGALRADGPVFDCDWAKVSLLT